MDQHELDSHLSTAIKDRHLKYAELAIAAGANINAKDENGVTALHLAAFEANADMAAMLVSKGANIASKDGEGLTPLAWARKTSSAVTRVLEAADQHVRYAARVTEERKDKGPPQVGG